MNEPSITQGVKALEQKYGGLLLVLAFLRQYWGRVLGVICAAFVCGKFYNQFQTLQASSEKQTQALQLLDQHFQELKGTVGEVKAQQDKQEARWNAVTTEASIVITPKRKK